MKGPRLKRPLKIIEMNDGTLLMRCATGCPSSDVLAACGLSMRDLFPGTAAGQRTTKPRPRLAFSQPDAMRIICHEATVAMVGATDITAGKKLTPRDVKRLALAAGRLHKILDQFKGIP